ncbi:alpha/beta fold hydrolase [Nocardia sp. IBHARD005]
MTAVTLEEVILPGVGHIPMLENPELVTDALRAHLATASHRNSA